MSSNKNTAEKELKNIEKKSTLQKIIGFVKDYKIFVTLVLLAAVIGTGSWFLMRGRNPDKSADTADTPALKPGGPKTPTEAYQKLFAAVKSKDKTGIRALMSKDSMGLAQMQAGQAKKDVDEVLKNAFTSTVFADKLPPIRDERVKGRFGAIEVYDYSKSDWQDLPFVIEDGAWKLAVGNLFAGTYERPGKGRATIERENANAAGKTKMVPYGNGNVNMNVKPKIIDPMKDGKMVPPPNMQKGNPPMQKGNPPAPNQPK